jgi:hypothetical protein
VDYIVNTFMSLVGKSIIVVQKYCGFFYFINNPDSFLPPVRIDYSFLLGRA